MFLNRFPPELLKQIREAIRAYETKHGTSPSKLHLTPTNESEIEAFGGELGSELLAEVITKGLRSIEQAKVGEVVLTIVWDADSFGVS